MIEKNRDILSNALKDMPSRSPDTSNWDHISGGLDHLEASIFLSKNKSTLPKHKAPANAWAGIKKGLVPTFYTFLISGTGKLISSIILLGGIAGALLFFAIPAGNDDVEQIKDTKHNISYATTEKTTQIQDSQADESHTITEQTTQVANAKPDESDLAEITTIQKQSSNINAHQKVPDMIDTKQSDHQQTVANIPILRVNNTSISVHSDEKAKPLNPVSAKQIQTPYYKGSLKNRSSKGYYRHNDDDYFKRNIAPSYSMGLYYSYNQYQKMAPEGMKMPYHISSFGFEGAFEKSKWFIKLGLGYLNWEEEGDYIFDYNQMQMVYSYNYVDSAEVNPSNGAISYYTSLKEVYDSVAEQKSDQATYNYQSLQIPVLLGYNILEQSKFKVSLLGGVGIDFKISGKQYLPEFSEEDASIININNSLINRTKINWRIILGLNIDYRIADRWSIYAEPTYQQYMSPVYSQYNVKPGGMFNIKVGFRYFF
ncbi:MAG: outer membrane beta-barrel protein [Bacteroidota bacterium]